MISILVQPHADFQRGQEPEGPDRTIRLGRFGAAVRAASPFGLIHHSDGLTIAAEALYPPRPESLQEIARELLAADQHSPALGDVLALAVIDMPRNRLAFAVNIASSRSLFYVQRPGRIVCTTHAAELARSGVRLEWDDSTLPEYLMYRYVTPPGSLYRGVSRLFGGQSLILDIPSGTIERDVVWGYDLPLARTKLDPSHDIGISRSILRRNVAESLGACQHPGVLLSGGLDSTLLAALAIREDPSITSVSSSFGFINPDDREGEYARTAANHLGLSHDTVSGSAEGYPTAVIEAIASAEEPIHHLQSAMLHQVFKTAATGGIDMFLCGEAADGLFGNEAHRQCAGLNWSSGPATLPIVGPLYRAASRLLGRGAHRRPQRSYTFGPDLSSPNHFLWTLGQFSDEALISELFGFDFQTVIAPRQRLMQRFSNLPLLHQVSVVSLLCEGFMTMNVWGKTAEAQGIALSYPFASEALIHHVSTIPWEIKLTEPKYIVRQILRDLKVPDALIDRPKQSFGFPPKFWATSDGLLNPLAEMAGEMFDRGLIRRLQSVEGSSAMLLWNLINLFVWHRIMIEGVPAAELVAEVENRRRTQGRKAGPRSRFIVV
jgi:asparagine synthase (glutamine-hydrolysing)